MTAAVLAAHGLSVALPSRWEGRLYLREEESANPVLHMSNFALPPSRGDFGTGAVELMGEQHVFVALFEYGAEEADRPLFAAPGFPRLTVRDFAANQLQRKLPGQLGCQRFFTDRGRAFCLYVVLGSRRHAAALVQEVHEAIARMQVGERWTQL
jgi:hypothetical protein